MELSSFWKENGVFSDVAADFRELLTAGMTRAQATAHILAEYQADLEDADDGIFVLAGLAYAQIQSGGILKKTREAVLSSCSRMTGNVSEGDLDGEDSVFSLSSIDNLKAYAEKGKLEKRERLFCDWKVNDVYALCLHGEDYISTGLEGKWLLLRTIDFHKSGRDIFPYVYLSLSTIDPFQAGAQPEEVISHAKYLPVMEAKSLVKHRKEPGDSSKAEYAIVKHIVYRAVLTWESQERFTSLNFVYVGNFENVNPPVNESLIPPEKRDLFSVPIPLLKLEYSICWRYEQYVKHNPSFGDG